MNIGDNTPWGAAQTADTIAEGITHVTTASHGGIHLSPDRNALVPDYMKRDGDFATQRRAGWYEEDCDWCIPVIVFEVLFTVYWLKREPDLEERAREMLQQAQDTFRAWHKDAYASHHTLGQIP
jgi:hypothetical protein